MIKKMPRNPTNQVNKKQKQVTGPLRFLPAGNAMIFAGWHCNGLLCFVLGLLNIPSMTQWCKGQRL